MALGKYANTIYARIAEILASIKRNTVTSGKLSAIGAIGTSIRKKTMESALAQITALAPVCGVVEETVQRQYARVIFPLEEGPWKLVKTFGQAQDLLSRAECI